jgi:hypothetical protein
VLRALLELTHHILDELLDAGSERRIDACSVAATGLLYIDPLRGAEFQARYLLLALQAGEPIRVAAGLAREAAHRAAVSEDCPAWVERALTMARELAERLQEPYITGLVRLEAAQVAWFRGDWPATRQSAEAAVTLLREHCRGVVWEITRGEELVLSALMCMGEFGEHARRVPGLFQDAQQRGDLYALAAFSMHDVHSTLARDEPEEGLRQLDRCAVACPPGVALVQPFFALLVRLEALLYSGRGQEAWDLLGAHPEYARSYMVTAQTLQLMLRFVRGRCALAAARAADPARPTPALLREAEHDARRIERRRALWGPGLAQLLRAGVAVARRQVPLAVGLLEKAEASAAAAHMALLAAIARRRRGQLLGGAMGAELIAAADSRMAALGARNPARFATGYAPGFGD